jgi:hypothetical protein
MRRAMRGTPVFNTSFIGNQRPCLSRIFNAVSMPLAGGMFCGRQYREKRRRTRLNRPVNYCDPEPKLRGVTSQENGAGFGKNGV